ncbi:MAG TPA: anti-sigma factor [Polyangiaceae bacterium]|nr:anti-sigma factor [Polyangiaceae bacterium]HOD21203.1 anti-sigma factor [Polyangiaceae bacterium]HOE49033.1 anti-sigma factor [Polyangiaceae bacterium]HOH01840.1 anti-sigma factor [Polyangiaceae bacterium]HOR34021.1 anti-sigma factor [Polyangiaceae bacterium]
MTCRDLARSLSAFVDGELDPTLALELQLHIDGCEACEARVKFARASRTSVRNAVKSTKASDSFRLRVATTVAQAAEAEKHGDIMVSSGLLSWKIAGPLAAAAAFVLVWASASKLQERNLDKTTSSSPSTSQASMIPVDTLVDTLVDQHANPLPPETSSPSEIAQFDRFIGVPIRTVPERGFQGQGHLLGARMVPLQEQRAAMFQYVMGNGRRISMYIYNPQKIRLSNSPILREIPVRNNAGPVYVGCVRGYSVAVTDRRGVGYAMASDLDESESSRLLLAVGDH